MGRNSLETTFLTPPLLAGYFGHGNAGDEMILALLQQHLGPAFFVAGSSLAGPGAVPRFDWPALLGHLRRSGGLLLGGGELFQSRTSYRSLAYYGALMVLARLLRRPLVGFSLSIDEELGKMGRFFVAGALRRAVGLWWRDESSRLFLAGRGVSSRSMPDVVWSWPVEAGAPPRSLRRVLWILRLSATEWDRNTWASAISSVDGVASSFLAMHPSQDIPALARLRGILPFFQGLESWRDPGEIFQCVARHDLVVTMRYHGLVAAALARRPAIAVPSHAKVRLLAQELGVPVVEPREVPTVDWAAQMRRAFEAGPPEGGDRPRKARAALEELAALFAKMTPRSRWSADEPVARKGNFFANPNSQE